MSRRKPPASTGSKRPRRRTPQRKPATSPLPVFLLLAGLGSGAAAFYLFGHKGESLVENESESGSADVIKETALFGNLVASAEPALPQEDQSALQSAKSVHKTGVDAEPVGELEAVSLPYSTSAGRLNHSCRNEESIVTIGSRQFDGLGWCSGEKSSVTSQTMSDGARIFVFGDEDSRSFWALRVSKTGKVATAELGYGMEVEGIFPGNRIRLASRGTNENLEDVWYSCTHTVDWEFGKVIDNDADVGGTC